MKLLSQRSALWSNHLLGNAPSIGLYGCLETDFTMIAVDCGLNYTPATLDDLLSKDKLFTNGDLLSDNTLDRAFPGKFKTVSYTGFNAAVIAAGVKSKNSYVILWIHTSSVPSHFVIAYNSSASYIADPWTGRVGTLSGYGGPSAVHKTTVVTHVPAVVPTPTPKPVPVPPPTPPTPKPIPPPAPIPDTSLQGLLVLLLNFFLLLTRKRG